MKNTRLQHAVINEECLRLILVKRTGILLTTDMYWGDNIRTSLSKELYSSIIKLK